jgi:hypothetical protein
MPRFHFTAERTSMNKDCGLAPFEIAHGFDHNGQRKLLTRTQWKMQGRRVVVSECDAKKIVTNKQSGRFLRLYDVSSLKRICNVHGAKTRLR